MRNSDAIFLGVLEAARTQLDEGSVVELPLAPALKIRSQFAFVALQDVSESAAASVRAQCTIDDRYGYWLQLVALLPPISAILKDRIICGQTRIDCGRPLI